MSLSKHSKSQSGRVSSSKNSRIMRPSSTEAKIESRPSPPNHKRAQPDSGFFESADQDLYQAVDKSAPSYGCSNEDWILYSDENVAAVDDGYYFEEEDAIDIASVKANHGSNYNGVNNEDDTIKSQRSLQSTSYQGRYTLEVIYENPQYHIGSHTQMSQSAGLQCTVSTLQRWVRAHEEHEMLAYVLEQPSSASPHDRRQQAKWSEEIDLSLYDVRR